MAVQRWAFQCDYSQHRGLQHADSYSWAVRVERMDSVVLELLPIIKRQRLVMEEGGLHRAMAVPVVARRLDYL